MIGKNENIQNTNQTNVNNTQVDRASGFSEPPFHEHSESDNIAVVVSDDKNKSVEQINEVHDEIKIDQISPIQSPISQYTTPPERSESSDTKTVNNDDSIEQEDDTDHDTDERELEEDQELEKGETILKEKNEPIQHDENEVTDDKNFESNKILSDDESLLEDNVDDISKSGVESLHKDDNLLNPQKKKTFKSPFVNLSKGEKALLLFVALSFTAFIASFISSVLGKPPYPDKKGNLILLAILGTVAIISVAVSLVHFHYSDKSKGESLPLSALGDGKIVEVFEDKKHV